ncbi:MAG TPA: hypothetical protein VEK07_00950 [Polyangiaceae bacterium]|nr:hypothetical protein [Polyangiaceae bacterium]
MPASATPAASTPASTTAATELLELDVVVLELAAVDELELPAIDVLVEALEPPPGPELEATDIEAPEAALAAASPAPMLLAELETPIVGASDPEPADPPVGVSAGSKSTTSRPHAETSAHVAPTRHRIRSFFMAKRAPLGARPPE